MFQPARPLGVLAAVLALLAAARSHASSTVVPDNFLTVQGAVDSTVVDSIYVREGEYAEDVAVHRDVIIVSYPRVAAA